jgi:DNA-binding response OmpR family regulator
MTTRAPAPICVPSQAVARTNGGNALSARVVRSRPRVDAGDGQVEPGPILVVESDRDLGRTIVEQLHADGYSAKLARSAEHARVLALRRAPALAVIGGLGSPCGTLELLKEIRAADCSRAPWEQGLPAIVVDAQAQELDMLRAFEAGADDFLDRPDYLELRARLRAVLRRSENTTRCGCVLRVDSLAIDPSARAVSMRGQKIHLRRLEFDLLLLLAGDPERVFAKDELLRVVWGYRASGSTRTVDSHASRLRRKLEQHDARRWVINVWGVGYRLI